MIRLEKSSDHHIVNNLTREAFWNLYIPGCDEHYILHKLRKSQEFIPDLSFVIEEDGQIIAHIAFSKSEVRYDDGSILKTITFGPVSVSPSRQIHGYGSKLINYSTEKAKDMGYKCIIIYGHPSYYTRFGFKCTKYANISGPDGDFHLAHMFLELQEGYLKNQHGIFYQSSNFNTDQKELEQFQSQFPPKQKYRTLSQKTFEIVSQLHWNQELNINPKDAYNRDKINQDQ